MPVFNELCLLDVSTYDINHVQLEVVVMDYDRFGRNDEVGGIEFGKDSTHTSGQVHWNKVVGTPSTCVTFWHAIGSLESATRLGTHHSRLRSRSRSPARPASCVSSTGMQF